MAKSDKTTPQPTARYLSTSYGAISRSSRGATYIAAPASIDAPRERDYIDDIMQAQMMRIERDLEDVKGVLSMIGSKLDALNERSIRLDSSLPHLATKLEVRDSSEKIMEEVRKRPRTSQLIAILTATITVSTAIIGAPFFGSWWSAVKALFK